MSGERPRRNDAHWIWGAVILFGIGAGIGAFAFVYGRGHAYLTDDARACVQCHVMNDQFSGWNRSTHHAVATCNSCHAPDDFLGKYATKAINGFNHSLAFTTGKFSEPIRIKKWNLKIAEQNCRRCHGEILNSPKHGPGSFSADVSCTHCHQQVGHPH